MKKKFNILFLSFVFLFNNLFSQNLTQTIKGKIVDKESQQPLAGATITIPGTDPLIGAVSGFDGEFRLEKVHVGRYTIHINFLGYEPFTMQEVLVGSGKEVVLNIELIESSIKMDEVEVKGQSNKDQAINSMATVSARSFNVEEARRYAGGADDPARMASAYAGVTSNYLSDNGIIIRGNSPRGLLWQMEGIEISNPSHLSNVTSLGGGAITALSSQMISNSDFFTGAFPAEYGNALSGVFDLKIRNGNNEKREHTFQAGTLGVDFSSEGPFVKGKKASYLFNYRFATFYLIMPLLPKDATLIKYQDLSIKLNFPTQKAGTFSVWGLTGFDSMTGDPKTDSAKWETEDDRQGHDGHFNMGVIGLNHKIIINSRSYLNSSLAACGNGFSWDISEVADNLKILPDRKIMNNNWKYTFKTYLNYKFSPRHTNRTGFNANLLYYNLNIKGVQKIGDPLLQYVDEKGHSFLYQAFSQSKFDIGKNLVLNAGIHSQYFMLDENNKHYTIEPRLGLKWNFYPNQNLSFSYGNHSQVEMLQIYFAQQQTEKGVTRPNESLGFSKAHHFIIGYDIHINKNLRLAVEPYYQSLYNIPVNPGSSFSMINLENEYLFNDSLVNKGTGRNIGIDFTIEKFLDKGYYYLITASVFDSNYKGGDNIEHSTRYNKNFVFNILGGKEWTIKHMNKISFLGINGRFTLIGGNRISPVNMDASLLAKEIIYNENKAFLDRKPTIYYLDLSITYRKNKEKYSGIWALQVKNALNCKEFEGYKYNYKKHEIFKSEDSLVIPIISYKIEF